jgi:1-acyl-sn-glycerol-3-phosphate acyltransferase
MPEAGMRPVVTTLRALLRMARVLVHVLRGWWTIRRRFPALSPAARQQQVQRWALGMLDRMGIALELSACDAAGGLTQAPLLLVSNHVSWLDILVLHASRFCRFVSKDDVRGWPLLGALATGAGTLYIERGSRRDAQRVVQLMAASLQRGEVVALFPEGTTSEGRMVLPFHGNLLQSAIDSGVPALPLALAYLDGPSGQLASAAAYVNDDSLLASVWRVLKSQGLRARLAVGQPELAAGRSRRDWAADLRQRVQGLLACAQQAG